MLKYFITGFIFICFSNPSFAFLGFITDKLNKAKVEQTCINLKIIKNTLDIYRLEHFKYPSSEEGLAILTQENLITKSSVLNDSWDTPYQYEGDGSEFSLLSLGADKKVGGKDFDADLTLESCLDK